MKILLINPPLHSLRGIRYEYFPIGLGYVAAALERDGFSARIYNAESACPEDSLQDNDPLIFLSRYREYIKNLADDSYPGWLRTKEVMQESQPDLAGIYVTTPNMEAAKKITSLIKEYNSGCLVVWGGPHPSALPEEALRNTGVDFVVRGEGEETMLQLCRFLSGKSAGASAGLNKIPGISYKTTDRTAHNPQRSPSADLDALPMPARHLLVNPPGRGSSGWGTIMGSRGCPYKCIFCSAGRFWTGPVRFRRPENVLDEIKYIINAYDTRYITFQDDCFLLKPAWAEKICREIIRHRLNICWECYARIEQLDRNILRLMKRAGCYRIHLGIETGSPRMLKLIKKGISAEDMTARLRMLRRANMVFTAFFILGFPQETEDDIARTKDAMRNIGSNFVLFLNTLVPYPGTEAFRICRDLNTLPEPVDWGRYSQQGPENHFVRDVGREELRRHLDEMSGICRRHNYSVFNAARRAATRISYWRRHPGLFMKRGIYYLKIAESNEVVVRCDKIS